MVNLRTPSMVAALSATIRRFRQDCPQLGEPTTRPHSAVADFVAWPLRCEMERWQGGCGQSGAAADGTRTAIGANGGSQATDARRWFGPTKTEMAPRSAARPRPVPLAASVGQGDVMIDVLHIVAFVQHADEFPKHGKWLLGELDTALRSARDTRGFRPRRSRN